MGEQAVVVKKVTAMAKACRSLRAAMPNSAARIVGVGKLFDDYDVLDDDDDQEKRRRRYGELYARLR